MTQVMMMDNPDLNGVDFPFAGGRSAVHTTSPTSLVRAFPRMQSPPKPVGSPIRQPYPTGAADCIEPRSAATTTST
jgi:hypothetical protein